MKSMNHHIFFASVIAFIVISAPAIMANGKQDDINPQAILDESNLENGKSIYVTGAPLSKPHLSFNAGPHWLRTEGGGCGICHGPKGLGNIQPEFCFVTTPPITFKYLTGDGYPSASRQNGTHPNYSARTLQRAIETGIKPNGYELDYCMPRWRISDKDFKDLLGHLISLDN